VTDLAKLREARDAMEVATPETREGVSGTFVAPINLDQMHLVFEAVSTYADLLENGQQVQWCEAHDTHVRKGTYTTDCRIVSKLLIEVPE
jgi:hypothetical protein